MREPLRRKNPYDLRRGPPLKRTRHPPPAHTEMKVLTVLMYLSLVLIATTVYLTVTSNGRISWDESIPVLVALSVLFVTAAMARVRAARRTGEGASADRPPHV